MTERFETFVLSINRIYRCIQKIKSREMTELGLQGPHVMCLFQLRQNPDGLTAAELSALCMEDKAGISRAVARLEEKGLVRLEAASEKRRYRAKICLTSAGEKISGEMVQLIEQAVFWGGRGLSEAQRASFYDTLNIIAQNLNQICAGEELLHESSEKSILQNIPDHL